MHKELTDLAKQLIAARERATPNDWEGRCKEFSNSEIPRHIWTTYGWIGTFNSPLSSALSDVDFTCLAANNITQLCEAYLAVVEDRENLAATLEAVRSQMCWEKDRDQLTMGFNDLHTSVTKAIAASQAVDAKLGEK
ncbi:MAG: hypothetical protein H0X02_08315 [Nitrosomonas sp.]|nr:hypothetical protein [Nitrosomonas sp.]